MTGAGFELLDVALWRDGDVRLVLAAVLSDVLRGSDSLARVRLLDASELSECLLKHATMVAHHVEMGRTVRVVTVANGGGVNNSYRSVASCDYLRLVTQLTDGRVVVHEVSVYRGGARSAPYGAVPPIFQKVEHLGPQFERGFCSLRAAEKARAARLAKRAAMVPGLRALVSGPIVVDRCGSRYLVRCEIAPGAWQWYGVGGVHAGRSE